MSGVDSDTMKRGMFIVFEGIDRSGKTTQAHMLVDALRAGDIAVEFTRFPRYDTHTGKLIQQYLRKEIELDDKTAHLLYCANRTECIEEISSLLRNGISVVCDRYVYSGIAYATAKGLSYEWCRAIETGLPKPDVVFYFELEPAQAAQRKDFGVNDRHEDVVFLEKVADAYTSVLGGGQRCLRFDASKPIDELALEVSACAAQEFNTLPLDSAVKTLFTTNAPPHPTAANTSLSTLVWSFNANKIVDGTIEFHETVPRSFVAPLKSNEVFVLGSVVERTSDNSSSEQRFDNVFKKDSDNDDDIDDKITTK